MELVLIVLLVALAGALMVACAFMYEKIGNLTDENAALERRLEGMRAGLVAVSQHEANGRDRLKAYLAAKTEKRGS